LILIVSSLLIIIACTLFVM